MTGITDTQQDDLILQELKNQKLDGLTQRCKAAVRDLADEEKGAEIFLFVSMNARLRKLEETIVSMQQ